MDHPDNFFHLLLVISYKHINFYNKLIYLVSGGGIRTYNLFLHDSSPIITR